MYLYLGQSTVIPFQEIMGIFDLDNASWAYKTREFLERAEREGRAVWLTDDLPRSVVMAAGRDGRTARQRQDGGGTFPTFCQVNITSLSGCKAFFMTR